CVMLCCLLAGCGVADTAGKELSEKRHEFSFISIDGKTHSVNAAIKATALVFILPDCPICNSYIPELNRLHEEFAPRGVSVLLVHADADMTADKAASHASEYNIQCPIVLDAD